MQLQHARMLEVEGVAGTREIHVIARIVGHQSVVGRIVDPAEGQRGSHLVAFGGVVVDHIEDHLDSR